MFLRNSSSCLCHVKVIDQKKDYTMKTIFSFPPCVCASAWNSYHELIPVLFDIRNILKTYFRIQNVIK